MDRSRAAACIWGIFFGDALAMPVHWYYDLGILRAHFPNGIRHYEAPPKHLPGSILNLSNTGGGGRGGDQGSIVGDVINHGKRQYWKRGADFHYHCTLVRGENTLEAQLGRVLLRSLAEDGGAFVRGAWLERFARFMTTPGSHNDTYASTYIRMFFVNREAGRPLDMCADNDGHNTDAIDALTLVPPVVISALARRENVHDAVTAFVSSTRRSSTLPGFCHVYADMLVSLLSRDASTGPADALRAAAVQAGQKLGTDVARQAAASRDRDPMCACYISSALPVLLIFAYKYADDPVRALLASANAGGENVARGAALGALFGAAYGDAAWSSHPWLKADLKDQEAITAEISGALHVLFHA